MAEKPILFSGPMIRAILGGTKTQTRRAVKSFKHMVPALGIEMDCIKDIDRMPSRLDIAPNNWEVCPYGVPGDRLWVREAWSQPTTLDPGPTFYRADYPDCVPSQYENVPPADQIKWKPSIHMRRDQSRITLEITGVRVERLQDISAEDATAEGAPPSHPTIDAVSREFGYEDFPRSWYAQIWEQINGPGSWSNNPWVWVISFRKIKP